MGISYEGKGAKIGWFTGPESSGGTTDNGSMMAKQMMAKAKKVGQNPKWKGSPATTGK